MRNLASSLTAASTNAGSILYTDGMSVSTILTGRCSCAQGYSRQHRDNDSEDLHG
jgi:hypothetical protein